MLIMYVVLGKFFDKTRRLRPMADLWTRIFWMWRGLEIEPRDAAWRLRRDEEKIRGLFVRKDEMLCYGIMSFYIFSDGNVNISYE